MAIEEKEEAESNDKLHSVSKIKDNLVRIGIDIRISNRLHLSQKNLSYQNLVRMVEILEVLCWVLRGLIIFWIIK